MGLVHWTRHHSEQGATPMSDHARGCEGRNYTCTCGHDASSTALVERLTKALEKIAVETTIGEPFKSEDRIMSRDAMIDHARSALSASQSTSREGER
jgi:hypothetical protein